MTWRSRYRASAHGQAGFSLAEVLVVLAIIGLLVAVVPIGVSRMLPGARLADTAQKLAGELRSARAMAMETGVDSGYRIAGNGLGVIGRAGPMDLAKGISVEYWGFDPSGRLTRQDDFRFLADGSSTGGYFRLRTEEQERRVAVHWLFGHVEVQDGEGAS